MSDVNKKIESQLVDETIQNYVRKSNIDRPFYVADLTDVADKIIYWRNKIPRVEPFYAMKCNSDQNVIRLMVSLGMRFDCANQEEIASVMSAGAKSSDIIYANPFKSRDSIRYASSVGVDLMTFDCESELLKISRIFSHARLVLRISIPNVHAVFQLNDKFGCELEQTKFLLTKAKSLNLNVVGVSFHVGSLCKQASAYYKAIGMARQVFDTAEELDMHLTLLNIGGGYPGAKGTRGIFEKMCYFINQGLDEFFPVGCGVRVIAEPGCYMVCSAYTLCTKVLGKKLKVNECDGKTFANYYLNDGIFGSFAKGFEGYRFHKKQNIRTLEMSSELSTRPILPSRLWGVTCSSVDYIIEDVLLPELNEGDYLIFDNMGAYTQCLKTNFNGCPNPETKYIFPCLAKLKNSRTFENSEDQGLITFREYEECQPY